MFNMFAIYLGIFFSSLPINLFVVFLHFLFWRDSHFDVIFFLPLQYRNLHLGDRC
ncbi:MAG: hypothetical protein BYD32DRAFT_424865 [Podila humilis]|nr:MAG: hypothetical protein BYD32DRAFT_424865 [Podila humilis]